MGRTASPEHLTEADLTALLPYLGTAPKTKHVALGWLGSFLKSHKNNIVEESGITYSFSTISTSGRRRWLTEEQLEAVMDSAKGVERVIVALEGFQGLRRIEVMRARLDDLHLVGNPPTMGVRGKGYLDTVSREVPLASRVMTELGTYMPTRSQWGAQGKDSPYLLVYLGVDGNVHPYKEATPIDRMVIRAGARAGIRLSNHDLRRTFGRILRNRGANLLEIRDLYGHASVEMTEHYIGSQQDRMATAIRLLDSNPMPR
jgi:integrase